MKRGRKEKRHKEAQAVLAAAAVASSSRNSTLRKDAKEDAAPAKQEVFVVFGWSIEKLLCAAMDLTLLIYFTLLVA
jgi:hypothetical protein